MSHGDLARVCAWSLVCCADDSGIIKDQISKVWQFSHQEIWKLSSAQAGGHQVSGIKSPEG